MQTSSSRISESHPQSEISDRKLEANRQNALHSTGPKTEAGKLASSGNHRQHGLTGTFTILPGEDEAEFHRLHAAFRDEHQPATETESVLILEMARHHWLYQRALRLQDQCFLDDLSSAAVQQRLSLYLRYGNTHERAFSRCLQDLCKLRKEKLKLERGFESQARERAAELRRATAEKRTEQAWDSKRRANRDHTQELRDYFDRTLTGDEFVELRAMEIREKREAAAKAAAKRAQGK